MLLLIVGFICGIVGIHAFVLLHSPALHLIPCGCFCVSNWYNHLWPNIQLKVELNDHCDRYTATVIGGTYSVISGTYSVISGTYSTVCGIVALTFCSIFIPFLWNNSTVLQCACTVHFM